MIVTIREWTHCGKYSMGVDLAAIEKSCGRVIVDKYEGVTWTDYTVRRCKKLFRYLRQHVDEDQLKQIEAFCASSKNAKMRKAWADTAG